MPYTDHTVARGKACRVDDAERADEDHADELDDDRDQSQSPGAASATRERDRRDDVDQCGECGEQVRQGRLIELREKLNARPGSRGKSEDAVNGDQDTARAAVGLADSGALRLSWGTCHVAGVHRTSSRRVMASTASAATASTMPEKRLRSALAQNHAIGIKITMPIR